MDAEEKSNFPPVYEHSLQKAVERGELEQYQISHKLNIECAKTIDTMLTKYFDHDTYELYTEPAAREVLEKFGYDRTMAVLANTVRHFSWDGRFSRTSREWAKDVPRLNDGGIDRSCLVSANAGLTDQFVDEISYDYLLTQPLKPAEIKAEAEQVLKLFQDTPAPNSPDKTKFMAKISPEFHARAKPKDFVDMLNLLPFKDPKLTTLPRHKGFFAVIKSDEVRNKPLRKPSVLAKLAAKPVPGDKPVGKKHDREVR